MVLSPRGTHAASRSLLSPADRIERDSRSLPSQASVSRCVLPGTTGSAQARDDQSPAVLSPSVRRIVAPVPDAEYQARLDAVHALGRNLGGEEVADLIDYLRAHRAISTNPYIENSVRNDIMDKLVEQETISTGLVALLIGVYQDRNQDVVMNDYAVQHMSPVYRRVSREDQKTLRKVLWQAIGETDSSIAGTALLVLYDIVDKPNGMRIDATASPTGEDRAALVRAALRLAGDEHCGELSRITAVQVCGRMGIRKALPMVTQLAQNAQSIPLRISAVGVLGDLGDMGTLPLLEQIAQSQNKRLSLPVQSAIARIRARAGGS